MNVVRPWTAPDVFALVFALSIAFSPVGLVLAIMGIRRGRKAGIRNRRAIAALIISVSVIVATVVAIAVLSFLQTAREQAFQREYFCSEAAKSPDLFSDDGLGQELLAIYHHDGTTLVPYLQEHSADLTARLDAWRNLLYAPPGEIEWEVEGIYDTLDRTVTNLNNGVVLPEAYLDKAVFAVERLDTVKAWMSRNCLAAEGE